MAITGLSMAARAQVVPDRAEAEKVLRMLPLKYPEAQPLPLKMPGPDVLRTRIAASCRWHLQWGSGRSNGGDDRLQKTKSGCRGFRTGRSKAVTTASTSENACPAVPEAGSGRVMFGWLPSRHIATNPAI